MNTPQRAGMEFDLSALSEVLGDASHYFNRDADSIRGISHEEQQRRVRDTKMTDREDHMSDQPSDVEFIDAAVASSSSESSLASVFDNLRLQPRVLDATTATAPLSWLQNLRPRHAEDEQARTNVRFWVGGLEQDELSDIDDPGQYFLSAEDVERGSNPDLFFDFDGDNHSDNSDLIRVESTNSISFKGSTRSCSYSQIHLQVDPFLRLTDDPPPLSNQGAHEVHGRTSPAVRLGPEIKEIERSVDRSSNGHQDDERISEFLEMLDLKTEIPAPQKDTYIEMPRPQQTRDFSRFLRIGFPKIDSSILAPEISEVAAQHANTDRKNICSLRANHVTNISTEVIEMLHTGVMVTDRLENHVLTCNSLDLPCDEIFFTSNPQDDRSGTPELCSSTSEEDESSSIESGLQNTPGDFESESSLPAASIMQKLVGEVARNMYEQWKAQKDSEASGINTRPAANTDQNQRTSAIVSSDFSWRRSSSSAKKRRLDDQDGGDDGDDEDTGRRDGRGGREIPPNSGHGMAGQTRLLACPYYKCDPVRYSERNVTEQNYRGCSSRWLPDIGRLKQHLYRVHEQPRFYCGRCYEAFSKRSDMDQHSRRARLCDLVPPRFTECMTDDMAAQIKKKHPKTSIVDTWYQIWSILFPTETAPTSPYMEDALSEEVDHFLGHFRRQAPEIIRAQLLQRGIVPLEQPDDTLLQDVLEGAVALVMQNYGPRGIHVTTENLESTPHRDHVIQVKQTQQQQTTTSMNSGDSLAPESPLLIPKMHHSPGIPNENDQMWLPGYHFAGDDQMLFSGRNIDSMEAPMVDDFAENSLHAIAAVYDLDMTSKVSPTRSHDGSGNAYVWS